VIKLSSCDEKGIRFESVTVPAAVMPGRVSDHGFGIPATVGCQEMGKDGKASKTGTSQKTCQTKIGVQSFREEKRCIIR
jgi:hypothetical protein